MFLLDTDSLSCSLGGGQIHWSCSIVAAVGAGQVQKSADWYSRSHSSGARGLLIVWGGGAFCSTSADPIIQFATDLDQVPHSV